MSQVLSSTSLDFNLGKNATIYPGTKPIIQMPSQVAASGWTDLLTTNLMTQGYIEQTTDTHLSFISIDICWYTWTLLITSEYLCHNPLRVGLTNIHLTTEMGTFHDNIKIITGQTRWYYKKEPPNSPLLFSALVWYTTSHLPDIQKRNGSKSIIRKEIKRSSGMAWNMRRCSSPCLPVL